MNTLKKNRNKKDETLIREYISAVLAEDYDDYGYGGGGGGGGGGGKGGGFFKNLNAAIGKIKKIGSRIVTSIKILGELVVTTILFWQKPEFDRISKEGDARIKEIESKHPTQSLSSVVGKDAAFILAVFEPSSFFAIKGADVIGSTLGYLTSGYDPRANIDGLFGPPVLLEADEGEKKKEGEKKDAKNPDQIAFVKDIVASAENQIAELKSFLQKESGDFISEEHLTGIKEEKRAAIVQKLNKTKELSIKVASVQIARAEKALQKIKKEYGL
jgi:hypothetical protein